jgi:hypothetical protein
MSKDVTMTTVYSLRNKSTGFLAELYAEENEGNSCSGEYRYKLQPGEKRATFPPFQVDTADKAALVMVLNTPWYNSNAEQPQWGSFRPEDYEVVQVVRTVEITPVAIEKPVIFGQPVQQYAKPRMLAERYLGYKLADDFKSDVFQMLVLALHEDETLESLQSKCRDRLVLIGKDSQIPERALGAFALPEDYVDLVKGPGVGIFLTYERR